MHVKCFAFEHIYGGLHCNIEKIISYEVFLKWMSLIGTQIMGKNSNVTEKTLITTSLAQHLGGEFKFL